MTTFKNVSATIVIVVILIVIVCGGTLLYSLFLPWVKTVLFIVTVAFVGINIYQEIKERE